jgi:DNA-binding CsgD family transcriptional regulator
MARKADSSRRASSLSVWVAASAAVVARLDQDDLPQRLLDALATLGRFEMACFFVYRPRGNPIHVHDNLANPADKVGLINYTDSTYVLNPFYNAYRRGLETGAYRMRDLAPDAYARSDLALSCKATAASNEEIGYLTHGWPAGMEELCLALELPEGECGEISLSRRKADGGFSDDDIAAFGAVVPFIAAAFRRYWPGVRARHLANTRDSGAEVAFAGFGGALLSPREREIAQLLLRGHSGLSIGAQLGISGTTVKTHRKNLYAKLGIATHYELFSLFLKSLKA